MLSTFRKIILVLIITAVVVFFGFLGFNVYLNYKRTRIKEEVEKERQEARKQLEEDERLKREIAEMTKQKLTG